MKLKRNTNKSSVEFLRYDFHFEWAIWTAVNGRTMCANVSVDASLQGFQFDAQKWRKVK